MNTKLSEEVFSKLFQIPDNKLCFECGQPSPQWASVNNGVFLCLNCSGVHRGFGVNVSFIRSVSMDTWSEKQLNFMLMGGNAKLRDHFAKYSIPPNSPTDFKFKTKAGQYYRDMLKALVENTPLPEAPTIEEGLGLLNFQNPNFDGSSPQGIYGGQGSDSNNDQNKDVATQYWNSFVSTVGIVANKTAQVTKDAYTKANEKMKDPEFQEKVKVTKDQTIVKTKEIGQKTAVVAKQGYESVKKGLTGAFGFLKQKANEYNGNNQPKQDSEKVDYQEYFDQTSTTQTQVIQKSQSSEPNHLE